MEIWFLLGAIAPVFWAISILIDTKLRKSILQSSMVLTIGSGLVGGLILLAIPFTGLSLPSTGILVACVMSGIIYLAAIFFYFKAIAREDGSTVAIFLHVTPVIIPFLANIFLGENLPLVSYLAFLLILSGAYLISFNRGRIKKEVLIPVLLAGLMFNIGAVLEKYIYIHEPFMNGFLWMRIGALAFSLIMLAIFNDKAMRMISKKGAGLITLTEGVSLIGVFFYSYSLSIAPVTIMTGLSHLEPVYVLILAVLLSSYFPKLYKESMENIHLKIIALILVILGLVIIG